MGDDNSASGSDDDLATVTIWDCSQCIQAVCWAGQPVDRGTEQPLCLPFTMVQGDQQPGPVLPPPLQ